MLQAQILLRFFGAGEITVWFVKKDTLAERGWAAEHSENL